MQLEAQKVDLERALKAVKKAAGKRDRLPILQCVILESDGPSLSLGATNFDEFARVWVPSVDPGEPFKVAIPYTEFSKAIKKLPKGMVSIKMTGEREVYISCGSSTLSIATSDADQSPAFPAMPEGGRTYPDGEAFKKAIALGSIAVSTDPSKPTLGKALLHLGPDRVASTNGYTLALADLPNLHQSDEAQILMSTNACGLADALVGPGALHLSYDLDFLCLSSAGSRLWSRRHSGTFPAYQKAIPAGLPRWVSMDRKALLSCLEMVGVKKDLYSKNARFVFEKPNLSISFTNPTNGTSSASMTFYGESSRLDLGFNIDYLADVLKVLPYGEVVFNFRDELGQWSISSPSLPSFRYILMPVHFAKRD